MSFWSIIDVIQASVVKKIKALTGYRWLIQNPIFQMVETWYVVIDRLLETNASMEYW